MSDNKTHTKARSVLLRPRALYFPVQHKTGVRIRILQHVDVSIHTTGVGGGRGFFQDKGTWGCAARKGILFCAASLVKGIIFGNYGQSRVKFW